ncbi:MAG: hypothetical protein VX777_05625 [Chlamydiota bacterium]|nr:hypothetical protein [Chlamydiota bacterium]
MIRVNEIRTITFELDTPNRKPVLLSKDGKKEYGIILFDTYGKRDTFRGSLHVLILKVWNAFKATYGQSVYQKAKKSFINTRISEYNDEILKNRHFVTYLKQYYELSFHKNAKNIIQSSKVKVQKNQDIKIMREEIRVETMKLTSKTNKYYTNKIAKLTNDKSIQKIFKKDIMNNPENDEENTIANVIKRHQFRNEKKANKI